MHYNSLNLKPYKYEINISAYPPLSIFMTPILSETVDDQVTSNFLPQGSDCCEILLR